MSEDPKVNVLIVPAPAAAPADPRDALPEDGGVIGRFGRWALGANYRTSFAGYAAIGSAILVGCDEVGLFDDSPLMHKLAKVAIVSGLAAGGLAGVAAKDRNVTGVHR